MATYHAMVAASIQQNPLWELYQTQHIPSQRHGNLSWGPYAWVQQDNRKTWSNPERDGTQDMEMATGLPQGTGEGTIEPTSSMQVQLSTLLAEPTQPLQGRQQAQGQDDQAGDQNSKYITPKENQNQKSGGVFRMVGRLPPTR